MDEIVETRLLECETIREIEAAADACGVPSDLIGAYAFDGWIDVSPDTPADTGYAVARALRGGRDFDPARPSDWHLRHAAPVDGMLRLNLSRTFRAPIDYKEA